MKGLTLVTLVGILLVAGMAWGQPEVEWTRTFGGQGHQEFYDIVQTADGGFACGGAGGNGTWDFWLVLTDDRGGNPRSTFYNSGSDDIISSLIETADGGFLLAGTCGYGQLDTSDVWVVRVDEDGNEVFARSYGGRLWEHCFSAVPTFDGCFALAGDIRLDGDHWDDYLLMKIDEHGNCLWSRVYGGLSFDHAHGVVQTADSGYAVAGFGPIFHEGADFGILRTDSHGDSLWCKGYGGVGYQCCESLVMTNDGGFALAGDYADSVGCPHDFLLMRLDENGDSLWSRRYGGEGAEWCSSVIQTNDGGFLLVGFTTTFGAGEEDLWLVRTDENGDSLWSMTLGGNSSDLGNKAIQTADGGFAVVGQTWSFGRNWDDGWLIKLEAEPNPPSLFNLLHPLDNDMLEGGEVEFRWEKSVDPNPNDTVSYLLQLWAEDLTRSFLSLDSTLTVNLDSLSLNRTAACEVEWWVAALSGRDTTECRNRFHFILRAKNAIEISKVIPSKFILYPPYPNPFNSSTRIEFGNRRPGVARLEVFDPLGRRVAELIPSQTLAAGKYSATWGASGMPSGRYIVRLSTAEGAEAATSVVLVK